MTVRLRGMPPGRPGRTWLRRRRATAERGADLLQEKLDILLGEEERFALLAERGDVEWRAAVADLDGWTTRAALLVGERGLRPGRPRSVTDVDVEWRVTMGVRHPAAATCSVVRAADVPVGSAAVSAAATAAERVVRAAVDEAVATAALAAVRAEVATTRRQLRAVTHRWLPRLAEAEAALAVALEDQEHEEQVRLRRAAAPSRHPTDVEVVP